jgi:NADH:ubiquinone oxidoreductase subunit E
MTEITVCIGSSCHLKGSYNVMQTFQQMIEECSAHDRVELKAAFCMKTCHNQGVSVTVDGRPYSVLPEQARAFFRTAVLGEKAQ